MSPPDRPRETPNSQVTAPLGGRSEKAVIHQVGGIKITTLSDGHFDLPESISHLPPRA